jgi:CRP-like cAMP-binding protein
VVYSACLAQSEDLGMLNEVARNEQALHNKLLSALPEIDWKRIKRNLTFMEAPAGKILCETGAPLDFAYFPIDSIISQLHVADDGASTEVATVGNEGMVGLTLVMGSDVSANRIVVQNRGRIYLLASEVLRKEFSRGGAIQDLLMRYTRARLTQISLTAVCNRRHSIEQQLCCWLLLSLDRLQSDELTMTHEVLANILGVRREGITEGAYKLQRAGLIAYRRGHITVIDRAGVEACCCECYRAARREFDRVLDPQPNTAIVIPMACVRVQDPGSRILDA